MECTRMRSMISQYMDGELSPDEKEAFLSHIRSCASCAKELEETRALRRLFASAESFPAPFGFAARVLANLEEREASGLRRLLSIRPFFVRAAEVAFALAVMTVGIISGNLLVSDINSPSGQATVQEAFALNLFQATPPDSIGGAYVTLMGADHER